MVKQGILLAMLAKVLEGAGKDPAAPALAERGPSPTPKVAEAGSIPTPDVPPTSKPEGAVCPEELALVPRRQHPEMPPLEDVYGSLVMPMGSSLDFTAPESLQVTTSHTSGTGEVHYCLQAHSTSRLSLLIAPSQEQLEPSSKIKEL